MATFEITIDVEKIEELSERYGLAGLLRALLNQILEVEMTEHIGAEPHERSDHLSGRRNGHYARVLTLRVGTIELRVPRVREGTFSTTLSERYERSEKALTLALMEMVVNGVSTRKVSNITEELCRREFSKSTVSELSKDLNEQVEPFNERPLDGQDYPFVIVDAMRLKDRRQRAVQSTSALICIGFNEENYREILGVRIADSESKQSWLETFRWLKQRGLTGVEFVTSDAQQGLVDALRQCFQGSTWQRCQTHFRRNIVDKAPRSVEDAMHEGLEDATAVLSLPDKYRRRLRTTNMLERLNGEVRRREKVVRIFPNDESAWRLIGAYLAERQEEWSTKRRYLQMDEFHDWRRAISHADDDYPKAAE